jgi:hypothetical protein
MAFGLRLVGDARDLAPLRAVAELAPALLDAAWTEVTAEGVAGSLIASAALDAKTADALAARGCDVVRARKDNGGLALTPIAPDASIAPAARWSRTVTRRCASLLEALRPRRVAGDPPAGEALFRVAIDEPGAQRTVASLLALGHDDVTVSEWEESDRRVLILRAPRAPMYLLLRAREEPHEGVTAFARVEGGLWVEWGWAHPLAASATRSLGRAGREALVDREGRWSIAPTAWIERSIFDAVLPSLTAARVDLRPADGESRFTVRVRLEPAAELVPELWLLDPEQFASLETFVEQASSDDLARLTVARMEGPRGVVYVLRELVRPGISRLGTRVSDLLGLRGFARATGIEQLYLPVGRRLAPALRKDDLRPLLGLDTAALVVLDEDPDGPVISSIASLEERPLSRWVDHVATDRRHGLDRLLERMVFDLPEITVEPRPAPVDARPEASKPPKVRRAEPATPVESAPRAPQESSAPAPDPTPDEAALREQARVLERQIARGACDDDATWRALGETFSRLHRRDEAAFCLEAATFHRPHGAQPDNTLLASLLALRAGVARSQLSPSELLALCARDALLPPEASLLGATALAMIARDDPALDAMAPTLAQRFAEPSLPVSRRLAWLVLSGLARRASDRLGMTRAAERTLGALNVRGLHEALDLPPFVRLQLALDPVERGEDNDARAAQHRAVEAMWSRAVDAQLPRGAAHAAVVQLQFATAFQRIGDGQRAQDLLSRAESALPALDALAAAAGDPNPLLIRLYLARISTLGAGIGPDAWSREVSAVLESAREPRRKDRAEFFRKKSAWLNPVATAEVRPAWSHLDALEQLVAGESDPQSLPAVIAHVFESPGLFDHERFDAIDRALAAALRTGNDKLLAATLEACAPRLGALTLLGHRASSIGACLRAAATLGDASAIDVLLEQIIAIARGGDRGFSVRDLLGAVTPGIAALRKTGASESAKRLFDALDPIATQSSRDALRLRAALAQGWLQLGEPERGLALIDGAIDGALAGTVDYGGRFEVTCAALEALARWPAEDRAPRCERVFDGLDAFGDNFTTARFFATYKLLTIERVIDAITDEVTLRSEKVRGFLEGEEQVVRRRILSDWRSL